MPIKCPCCEKRIPSRREIEDAMLPDGTWSPRALAYWGIKFPPPDNWEADLAVARRNVEEFYQHCGVPLEQVEEEPTEFVLTDEEVAALEAVGKPKS